MGRFHISTTIVRIVLALLIVREVWLLLGVPQIANIFINFCTIGLIPGTNISLAPTIMFVVMGLMSVMIVGLLFYGNLSGLFMPASTISDELPDNSDVTPSVPPTGIRRKLGLIDSYMAHYLELGVGLMVKYMRQLWVFIKPYSQQLDAFLDRKFSESEFMTVGTPFLNEMGVTMAKWFTHVKEAIGYSVPPQESQK